MMPCSTGTARSTCSTVPEIDSVSPRSEARTPRARCDLDEVGVVDAGEKQRVGAFDAKACERDVSSLSPPSVSRCEAPSDRHRAPAPARLRRVRVPPWSSETRGRRAASVAPARSMAIRSKPIANPPIGGAPLASPSSRNPNRRRCSSSRNTEQLEDALLQVRVRDPDGAAAQLVPVVHRVVVEGPATIRLATRGTESPRDAAT